jgi:hypothetical protein
VAEAAVAVAVGALASSSRLRSSSLASALSDWATLPSHFRIRACSELMPSHTWTSSATAKRSLKTMNCACAVVRVHVRVRVRGRCAVVRVRVRVPGHRRPQGRWVAVVCVPCVNLNSGDRTNRPNQFSNISSFTAFWASSNIVLHIRAAHTLRLATFALQCPRK